MNDPQELFTERDAIIKLIKTEHQVTMDATIWVYKLGELAQDQCEKYSVSISEFEYGEQDFRSEHKEFIYDSPEDAVDHYLKLIDHYKNS